MGNLRIAIDAGHGPGRKYNRGGVLFNEGDGNYLNTVALKTELEKYKNVEVLLTRENPSIDLGDIDLAKRSFMFKNVDLFLSKHTNAFSDANVKGAEIYDSVEKPNKALAEALVGATAKVLETPNRGVKYRKRGDGGSYYGVLYKNPAKSSMLIEDDFHTNWDASRKLIDRRNPLAKAQAEAIAKHYELALKDEEKDGWIEMQDGFYYYQNGEMLKDKWLNLDGKTYRLGTDGKLIIGWIAIGDRKYYSNAQGELVDGFQKIGGKTYYFKPLPSGRMFWDWREIDGAKYYFGADGVMRTGEALIEETVKVKYRFSTDGKLVE